MTIMHHALQNSRLFIDPRASIREFEKMIMSGGSTNSYPPYNVVRIGEDQLRLEFAVAGFGRKDVTITMDNRRLVVQGEIKDKAEEEYLYRGIATRKFMRVFELPEFVEVKDAKMAEGILELTLVRNVPEEKKPKTIQVK